MSFTRSNNVKATRKPHCCVWCATQIPAKSAAAYVAWMYDGDFLSGHFHPECYAAQEYLSEQDGEWEGYFSRGRIDDAGGGRPQFNPDGTRTEEPL